MWQTETIVRIKSVEEKTVITMIPNRSSGHSTNVALSVVESVRLQWCEVSISVFIYFFAPENCTKLCARAIIIYEHVY